MDNDDTKKDVIIVNRDDLEVMLKEAIKNAAGNNQIEWTEELDDKIKGMVQDALAANASDKGAKLFTGEDPKGGFKNFIHFAHDVFKAGAGGRGETEALTTWRGKSEVIEKEVGSPSQSAGDAEAGGYLIPTEFSTMLMERAVERSDIMQRAMIIPMATNKLDIPYLDGFNEATGKVAGNIEFLWKGEKAAYAAKDFVLGLIELNLRKCTGLAYMTDEILKFSPISAEPILIRAFDHGLNKALTKAFIRGTGAGQPLGVLNAPATVEVAKEPEQAADTFVYENMLKMFARNYDAEGMNEDAIWQANKAIVPQLGLMNIGVGTGGTALFVVNAQDKPKFTLFGSPLVFNSNFSALGDSGDIMYNDWSQYLIGQPTGQNSYEMQQSIHLKFDYDQTCYKFTFYIDGKPWWAKPFQPEYGDALSPFVKLEAR